MDVRIVVGIAVLFAGTMLVRIYRRVSSASGVTTKRGFSSRSLFIRVPGFGSFGIDQSEAKEAQRVLQSLNETIQLKLNPRDPQSVQQAIRQFDLDIDAKIAPYRHNRMVVEFAKKLKIEYRQVIQKLALSTSERK